MNLRTARVVLRPRTVADVLDLAAPFCLRGWRVLLPLAGLVLLPPFVACLAARTFLGWSWATVWAVALGLGGLCQAPFTIAYGELLFHDPRQVRLPVLLGRCARRLPAFLIAHIASRALLLLAAATALLWPFGVSALFAVHEAVLLEGSSGPFAAIGRSQRMGRGQGTATFVVGMAALLLPVVAVFAAEVTGQTVVATVLQLGEPFGTLVARGGTPYALAGFFLAIPLAVAARFLKYIDLRTRKEGWDIQLRFMEIAAALKDPGASTPGEAA